MITLPEAVKTSPQMDVIFIDGRKSFFEASSDWEYSKILMHDRTGVFVHNYNFFGVRKMVENIPRSKYQVLIIHPFNDSDTALIKKNAE